MTTTPTTSPFKLLSSEKVEDNSGRELQRFLAHNGDTGLLVKNSFAAINKASSGTKVNVTCHKERNAQNMREVHFLGKPQEILIVKARLEKYINETNEQYRQARTTFNKPSRGGESTGRGGHAYQSKSRVREAGTEEEAHEEEEEGDFQPVARDGRGGTTSQQRRQQYWQQRRGGAAEEDGGAIEPTEYALNVMIGTSDAARVVRISNFATLEDLYRKITDLIQVPRFRMYLVVGEFGDPPFVCHVALEGPGTLVENSIGNNASIRVEVY